MPERSVAYVLKGWPRISELFIASEVYRVEHAGRPLRLYVIRPPDEDERHPVVDRIRAQAEYLPATTSLSRTTLGRWLRANLRPFLGPLARTARRRPAGLARATAIAASQTLRERPPGWSAPPKVYVRELLHAVALADRLAAAPEVGHLHAHFAHGATTVTMLASAITGLPFSFTGHAKDIYTPGLNPAGLLAYKLRAARFAVTCTEANREHLLAVAPDAVVHRVYHGLNADFERLVAANGAPPAPRSCLRVLGVGRLVAKKGFDVLVDACDVLARRGVAFDAVIAGPDDGDTDADALRARIRALGLGDRVHLTGSLSQAELHEEYRRASALCLPCRVLDSGDRDGIPNVLVEAMACGTPVVSTAVSGIPEVVRDGVNGLLVGPDDPEAIADALVRLHDDPALAQRLGGEAQATVRRELDGGQLAGTLAALFTDVLEARS